MKTSHRAVLLAAPTKAPTEFRIFKAGVNETTKGAFIFDAAAAKSVMAAYTRNGVELPIDLEHLSLGDLSRDDAPDARGWFKLALRGGDLWAVDVTWTNDGATRLANRTQRYISPAFVHDEEGRVLEVVNAALVAMPATHEALPLVASKLGTKSSTMIGARVTNEQAQSFQRHARALGTTPGALLRTLAAQATAQNADVIAELEKLLGLQPGADLKTVIAQVQKLFGDEPQPDPAAGESAAPAPGDEGLSESPSIVPPAPGAASTKLSAADLEAANRFKDPATRRAFLKLRESRASESRSQLARKAPAPSAGGGRVFKTTRGPVTLSAREIKNCEELGAKLETYAENKAIRESARRKGTR